MNPTTSFKSTTGRFFKTLRSGLQIQIPIWLLLAFVLGFIVVEGVSNGIALAKVERLQTTAFLQRVQIDRNHHELIVSQQLEIAELRSELTICREGK